ncbi:MAG TPA: adenylate/guanylate cyclase domain-containing protein [Solirubrobacteraceae bacterium]|jgi:class 3 adenylate cyclase
MAPPIKYARSGELHIAYWELGDGPVDLLWVPNWIWECEYVWEEPYAARMFERLASFARVITFDRRGSGLSDPAPGAMLEEQMDDVVAVMDAVGSQQAAVVAMLEASAMACLFAATHPERTRALVLWEGMPRMSSAPDYEWALDPRERERLAELLRAEWGSGDQVLALSYKPDARMRKWAGRLERVAASPGTAEAIFRMQSETDVRPVLPSIQAPTLVMCRPGAQDINIRHSRYLAEHIPSARLLELPGDHTLPFGPGQELVADEVEEFLTGARRAPDPERVLATVMFGDIVGSTELAAQLGDRRWRDLLESFTGAVQELLGRFRGRAVKLLGDGLLATFDGPARGISCAAAMRDIARADFGFEVRASLHTGEVEVIGDDVGGMAVHIAARIIGQAGAGELVVSNTVKDLVVGSGIEFEDRGEHELRGVPGAWRLWSVLV